MVNKWSIRSTKMEQLFNQIHSLAKQPRLIPAEEVITRVLAPFESVLPKTIIESDIEQYEKILLQLLYVNSGTLSLVCCVRIAKCLILLYSKQQTPKLWNLFTVVTKKISTTGILVIGHVIDKIGQHSKSMIPGLVKILVNHSDIFPALFAINASFKQAGNELKQYAEKTFLLIKKAMQTKIEASHLIAIQTLMSLYPTEVIQPKKIHALITEVLFNNNPNIKYSAFVIDHMCSFIAYCAYYPLRNKQVASTKINDWNINNDKSKEEEVLALFAPSFEILTTYKSHFSVILRHLLDYLSPNFVSENLSILFKFVRKTQPSEISQLISLFGHDVRMELFNQIALEQPPSGQQQQLLLSLSFDDPTNSEIAALSLQLTTSNYSSERLFGASFFALLSEKNPSAAETYLNTALLYLACPPEDNPTLDKDIYGMALIASHIIGASEKRRPKLISLVHDYIELFLSHAYECTNINSAEFIATFMILAVLPPKYVNNEKCAKMISIFNNNFANASQNNKHIKVCTQYIAAFLATHPQIEGIEKFLEILSIHKYAQSYTTTLCSIIAATEAQLVHTVALSYFLPKLLSVVPSRQFILSRLSCPMLNSSELLQHTKFYIPQMDIIYFKVSDSYFAFRTVEFFPNVILSLEESFANKFLVAILTNTTNILMSHTLLLSVLKNVATQQYIPPDLNKLLLPKLDDEFTDDLRLLVTAECVALWASISEEALKEALAFLSQKAGIGKCFALASIFHYVQLSDSDIINILHDLDELAKIPAITPYALFSLSSLFETHSIRLSEISVADMQFPLLLSIMHSKEILSPFDLYSASQAFINLLPIVSPELHNSISEIYVKLLIQAFCSIPLPYAPQIMFLTLRSVFAFAKTLADTNEMIFPSSPGTSSSLQIAACGAFADMLKVFSFSNDENSPLLNDDVYFSLVPSLLVLLQKRNDNRIVDFIKAISLRLSNYIEPIYVKINTESKSKEEEKGENEKQEIVDKRILLVQNWSRIVKSILTNNSLPNLQIEASLQVKRVCSSICLSIFNLLAKITPLLNECLDDLMTSTTRAIETDDQEILVSSYKYLCAVLDKFNDQKTENGLPLLELYDSQFSIAIRHGFLNDLSITGEFLVKYLKFHSNNLIQRPCDFPTVLNGYADGIECFLQKKNNETENKRFIEPSSKFIANNFNKTNYYHELISQLCNIARYNKTVLDRIKSILPKFNEELSLLIDDFVSILSEENNSVDISIFRATRSSSYSQILVSFIWLHSEINLSNASDKELKNDKLKNLIEFLSSEIQKNCEEWRTAGAVEAVACFFSYFKANESLIEKVVTAILELKSKYHDMYIKIIPKFFTSINNQNIKIGTKLWKEILDLSLEKDSFNIKSIATLLGKNPPSSIDIESLIKKIYENAGNNKETLALLTILIRISWNIQLSSILSSKFDNSFKMTLLTRILKYKEVNIQPHAQKIGLAYFRMFKKGGMNHLASILIENPPVAYEILNTDGFKQACDFCQNDLQNSPVFLQFLLLALQQCEQNFNNENLKRILICAMKCIVINGNDPQKGREIVEHSIRIILAIQNKQNITREAFSSLSQREQQILVQLTEKQGDKMKSRMNALNLKQFSTRTKKSKNGSSSDEEWDQLEISD